MEDCSDLYSLYWNNHTRNLKIAFDVFRCDNELVDVTLSCEGRKIKAHKIILSACSSYFFDLFKDNPCQHPIIILRDVKYHTMLDVLTFVYQGEVNIAYDHLKAFLKTAELLQIKGLIDLEDKMCTSNIHNQKIHGREIDQTHSNSKLENQTKCNHLKENNVPLPIVPTELENDIDMEIMEQTPLKNELYFTENISTDFEDVNMINNLSSIEDDANKSQDPENREEDLQKSLTNIQDRDQYFPCDYCDKIFSHPNSLKLHLPKHAGSTSCNLCQAVLSRKYELKVHMRKKHNIDLY